MEGGSSAYPQSVLPILASSRKGTPHAASPPEVNVPTTPSAVSLALTFSQALSHIGVEVGDGEPIFSPKYPSPEGFTGPFSSIPTSLSSIQVELSLSSLPPPRLLPLPPSTFKAPPCSVFKENTCFPYPLKSNCQSSFTS